MQCADLPKYVSSREFRRLDSLRYFAFITVDCRVCGTGFIRISPKSGISRVETLITVDSLAHKSSAD